MSAKRMAEHDSLPRDLRLLLYEVGELPEWQMQLIKTNLKRNQVTVVMAFGNPVVIRPDLPVRTASPPRKRARPARSSARSGDMKLTR